MGKLHAVPARSTCRSQNVQDISSEPFLEVDMLTRCTAFCRAEKHISKSKCMKQTSSGPLLEVETWVKCMPWWREAHLNQKFTRHTHSRPRLEVETLTKCTPLRREAHVKVKMCKTHQLRTAVGSRHVDQMHGMVARSISPSQSARNTPAPDQIWELRRR